MDAPHYRPNHKSLPAWKKSLELAGKVYAVTRSLPSDERFMLDQQLRRSTVEIASNIAEGWARRTRAEFLRHLLCARSALLEVEIQTMIAIGQGYFDAASELPDDVGELGILLTRMIRNTTAGAQAAHAKACAPFEAIGGMNTRAEFESATGT